MFMNSTKMMFTLMMVISTLVTLSSTNWLSMWMGLEINLMSFIPLISESKNKKSSQAMMIYFLAQALGSVILLFSVMVNPLVNYMYYLNSTPSMMYMASFGVMIKLGAAPFHSWLPEMMANLNWMKCLILMTWQKLAPLYVMSNMVMADWTLYMAVMSSTLIGSIGGLNQTSLRKIMAYSSINHLGWMLMCMSVQISWYKYLLIYSILVLMICYMMNNMNVYFINQLVMTSPSMMEKYMLTMMMLSIGGLPPFLGFLPKWMVIQGMMDSKLYLIMLMMALLSLLTLFYYMRMMTYLFLSYTTVNKWINYKTPNKMMMFLFLLINMTLPISMTVGFF